LTELLQTEILNPELRSQAPRLAEQFAHGKPYRHVVIPDFFGGEFCRRLMTDFPAFDERIARNEMGNPGKKAVQSTVRDISPAYRELDDFIQTPEFLGLISDITGIPDLLYDPEYTGGGTHENLHGQGLDPHVDFNYHPRTGWHRRLNLIVYLNAEWEESWGGNFDLHSDPWTPEEDRITTVLPLFNHGVIFETSEKSWHGFEPVTLPDEKQHLSRRSFAIYLYTKDRPAEETAASHATVYVPRPIPRSVQPGAVLSPEDHHAMVQRFTLARNMLQFLYQREQRFNRQIDALRHALDTARQGQRLDLQGYAVQPQAPRGIWSDGWASSELVFEFSPTRPVRGLELDLAVPAQLETSQVLAITAGATAETHSLEPGERRTLRVPLTADPGDTVQVAVRASAAWRPKDAGTSGDDRSLAYKLLGASVEH